jgi:hypothetical protein
MAHVRDGNVKKCRVVLIVSTYGGGDGGGGGGGARRGTPLCHETMDGTVCSGRFRSLDRLDR